MQRAMQEQKLTELFQQKEKEIMANVVSNAEEIIKTEMELFKFEFFFPIAVGKKKIKETNEWLKKHRAKKWKEAMKKANGDEEKALLIYDEL